MVKEEGYNISDTGNWNMASDYSKHKLARNLVLVDEYAEIAQFGSSSLLEELDNYIGSVTIDIIKIKAFERLVSKLILIIDNALFAIKYPNDKSILDKYKKKLRKLELLIPMLTKTITNQRTNSKKIILNKDLYYPVLRQVLDIKADINIPLNKSHLIFVDKPEFDPKKYKKKIIDDAISRG